jgi:hypothetical protein
MMNADRVAVAFIVLDDAGAIVGHFLHILCWERPTPLSYAAGTA